MHNMLNVTAALFAQANTLSRARPLPAPTLPLPLGPIAYQQRLNHLGERGGTRKALLAELQVS